VSGTQILNERGEHESALECPKERSRMLEMLRGAGRPTLILSGDTHYGEVLKRDLGKVKQHEITSSPLSAPNKPQQEISEEPGRVAIYNQGPNFGVLTIDLSGQSPIIIAIIKDSSGKSVIGPYRVGLKE
jgi:hypothetical protein